MRWNNRIVVMLAIAATLLVGGCGANQREVTVMTYNIHHAQGMDKKLDLARVAGVIRDAKPDLVALQEVDAGTRRTNRVMQAEELARRLKMHHAYGPAMDYDGGKYGNAVLSRHKIVETRVIALPYKSGEQREPRSAVATIVALPGGPEIAFVSTHFDHTSRAPDRLDQAKALNRRLDDVREPAILAGDFNCEPGSLPMAELATIWTLVSNGDRSPTSPAHEPRTKIDHVLVKPADRWRVREAKVLDEAVASDHRPVVVKLSYTGD
jgi:endonuclease/exonuclease/phosphatase family metal-dependent hydrolase